MDHSPLPLSDRYSHTQRAPLCLFIYTGAVLGFALALKSSSWQEGAIAVGVGTLFAVLAPMFHYLHVEDQGSRLRIGFGPVPLFHKTISYSDIEHVDVGRTMLLDGWGIHMSLRGGWVWNLWGMDCVVIRHKKGLLRIGTDDAENLARFLCDKIDTHHS